MGRKIMRWIMNKYLRSFDNTKDRQNRCCFIGGKLKIKHYRWLHFNTHPHEFSKDSEDESK